MEQIVNFAPAIAFVTVVIGVRTADLQVNRQIRIGAGVEYDWNEAMTLGTSFVYVDLGDAEIESALFSGEYDTNRLLFFGLYSKWRW